MPPASILKECNTFLNTTKPLYKILRSSGEGFRRIKIRKKSKYVYGIEKYFDMAFTSQYKDLRLRSMVAHTVRPTEIPDGSELFYVFPVDGFKILYNKQIPEHLKYMAELDDVIGDDIAEVVLPALFNGSYSDDITSALESNSDVLIFDIPCYYAVRVSLVEDYNNFIASNPMIE